MRRSLVLRRDTLTDLTPVELTVVVGAASALDCMEELKSPSEIVAGIVMTVCACPMSRGCPTTR